MTEEVKLDLARPVQTKSGHKVRILCTDRRCADYSYQIIGLVQFANCDITTVWSHDEVHEYLENVPVNQEDAEANENCAGLTVAPECSPCIHFNSHPENCQSCKDLELDEGMAAIAASIDAREANRRNIMCNGSMRRMMEETPTNKEHPALGYLNEYKDKYKEKKEVIDFDLFS